MSSHDIAWSEAVWITIGTRFCITVTHTIYISLVMLLIACSTSQHVCFRWMLYLAIIFTLTSSIAINLPVVWYSSIDENGKCWSYANWPSAASCQAYAISLALWNCVFPLAELVYCYGRIARKLKKRVSVGSTTQAHSTGVDSNANTGTISKPQVNVIKTMIIITVTYALSTFIINFGYVAVSFGDAAFVSIDTLYNVYNALYFMNAWLDPFIYAIYNKEVRHEIWRISSRFMNRRNITTEQTTTNTFSSNQMWKWILEVYVVV